MVLSDFFFQRIASPKKNCFFFFAGVKVRENRLVK